MNISLNPNRRAVNLGGKMIDLTGQEYAFAEPLIEADGAVVSYRSMESILWPSGGAMDPVRHMRVVAFKLRRKGIGIQIRRGLGFRLEC